MDPIKLLTRQPDPPLTPDEDAALTQALSAAYHCDEAACLSRDVQRIAEKVRARMSTSHKTPLGVDGV